MMWKLKSDNMLNVDFTKHEKRYCVSANKGCDFTYMNIKVHQLVKKKLTNELDL